MKILAVSTWFPCPPDNGSKIRVYHLLRHLGSGHRLDLLTLTQSEADLAFLGQVRQFCDCVDAFPEPKFRPSGPRSWLAFFSPIPRYFQAYRSAALEAALNDRIGAESYDALLAMTLGAAPYLANIERPWKVLDQHNVESQVIKRRWEAETSPARRVRYLPTWLKAERFERSLASRFDAVTVVSERERGLLQTLLRNGRTPRVSVIPNGVDPVLLDYTGPARRRNALVFTGALSYQPNRDAALRLCRDILPLVRRGAPNVSVQLTGSLHGVEVSDLTRIRGVEFTGYVDDIRPVVASASALVVPLRLGGGTRLKILEAMALGTPVVSTPMGAEGLAVTRDLDILLGETDTEIANQVVKLLSDPELAARLAGNARELVRRRYLWPDIAAEFERVLAPEDKSEVTTG